jgi:hypothetical protein
VRRELGRTRHRREDNIKVDVKVIERGMDLFDSGYDSVADCSEHGNEPSDSITGRELLDWLSDYHLY